MNANELDGRLCGGRRLWLMLAAGLGLIPGGVAVGVGFDPMDYTPNPSLPDLHAALESDWQSHLRWTINTDTGTVSKLRVWEEPSPHSAVVEEWANLASVVPQEGGPSVAVFCFNTIYVEPEVEVYIKGSMPVALLARSSAVIRGVVRSGGDNGGCFVGDCWDDYSAGGNGGAGGEKGGRGCPYYGGCAEGSSCAEPGFGPGGGQGGCAGYTGYWREHGTGGLFGATDFPLVLRGGSGGGGGAQGYSCNSCIGEGGGGGGGGGAIEIGATYNLTIEGTVRVTGGGGNYGEEYEEPGPFGCSCFGWSGGGGSGGAVRLHGASVVVSGMVRATGGETGPICCDDNTGDGGGGRVHVQAATWTVPDNDDHVNVSSGSGLTDWSSWQHGRADLVTELIVLPPGLSLALGSPYEAGGDRLRIRQYWIDSRQPRFDIHGDLTVKESARMGALSGDGDVDIRSGAALVVGHKNQSTTFSGTIHGAGQLIKTGSSMLTFTGTNSCSNGTFIHQGTLAINRNDQLGSPTSILAFEDATLQANAALSIPHRLVIYSKATVNTQGYACDLPGLISSTGKLIKTGTGTLTLGGANSYGGGTTISQGTLVGSVSSFPGSITNDGQLVFIQAFGATFAGAISGAGSVVKRGAGKLTLSGDNTFTGTMTVEEGTLAISRDTSLGGAGKPVTLAGGTMLETTDDLTTGRAIALNAGLCTINVPTKMQGRLPVTATLSGAITGAGDLVKTGGGVLALSGTNSYLGSTWIKGGTLGASATTQLGAVSSGWLQFDGGTLRFTANGWIHKPTGLFAAGGTVDTNGHQALLSDQITGEGGLTKTGSGTLELSHASNNYEGPTRVLGGALGVSSNNNLGHPTSGIVLDGGTLKALASFPTPRAITLSGDSGAIDTNGKSVECAGPITGPGALNKAGPGALTLTGAANTYAGETRILQGTLAVASQLNLGPGSVLLSGSDAALNVSTSMIVGSGGPPALTVPNTVTTGGATVTSILKIATGGTLTVAGGTLSASEVDHTWGGTLLFSGGTLKVNTFRGSLTNQGGTLLANGFSGTTQVLGSYHQTAGTLEVRISGIAANQFGKLNVTGSAQLGGGLKVSLGGGFTPTAGQRFPILTSGNQSGTFANAATYVDVVGGGRFQVSYTGADVVLTNYVPFTVIDLAEGQSFAVNCGGGPVAATSMGDFAGDQQYGGASNNAWGYTAGGAYWYGGGIFGAPGPLEEVFRDLRSVSSDFEYRFAMKHNGTYQLDLLFAEIAAGNRNALRQGLRIFHVEMEGQRVLRNWSPVEAAGGGQVITQGDGAAYTAAVRTFTVDVLDNELNVLFRYLGATSPPSTPIINGIKITRLATRPPGPPSGDLEDMTVTDEAVANILGIDDIDGPGPFENHIDLGPPAIRSASLAADASSAAGAYTIRSAGGDIWDNWDRGHFLYRKVPGNYVLESDLEWASPGPNVSAKMGLMARTNLTGNAAAVFVETIGGGTNPNPEATAFQARTSDGAGTSLVAETPAGPAGSGYRARRLRLERSGRNFKAWWDNGDGHGLRVLGSVSLPPDTPEEMYWGLALTSHDESFCSEGRFTNLREYLPRDSDWDGVADYADNCPYHDNRDQDNADQDSAGDACDGCPGDDEKVEPGLCGCWDPDDDSDGDGTLDCQDECWGDPNKVNPGVCGCGHPDVDSDSDGRLDCEDDCPADSNKTLPGVCGCGYSDTDTDGDGVADCADGCPNDPTRTAPGLCGCGQAEFDADADGVVDCLDNCPGLANPGQADLDGDHAGDACDLDDDSLLVSEPDMVLVPEGGTADLSVKLRFSPPFPPPITWLAAANWLSGDQSIVVVPRPPLVFDYTNWNVYQTVTLSALPDSDIENGQAYIQCLIPYVGSKIIRVVEQDRDRPGDFDGDNDVDQDDFELFETCASGPAVGLAPGCEGKDLDRDGDIDQDDFGRFQRCYSGAGKPSNPNCAN